MEILFLPIKMNLFFLFTIFAILIWWFFEEKKIFYCIRRLKIVCRFLRPKVVRRFRQFKTGNGTRFVVAIIIILCLMCLMYLLFAQTSLTIFSSWLGIMFFCSFDLIHWQFKDMTTIMRMISVTTVTYVITVTFCSALLEGLTGNHIIENVKIFGWEPQVGIVATIIIILAVVSFFILPKTDDVS